MHPPPNLLGIRADQLTCPDAPHLVIVLRYPQQTTPSFFRRRSLRVALVDRVGKDCLQAHHHLSAWIPISIISNKAQNRLIQAILP
jgi:hypothetical protein